MSTDRHDGPEANDGLDRTLDRALEEIRRERPDATFESAASARVWARLSVELEAGTVQPAATARISSCGDFQAMLPDYLAGGLPKARVFLLEDHLGECVPCRRALKERRSAAQPKLVPREAASHGLISTWGWRAAAAAVVFLTVVGFSFKSDVFSFESGGLIRIEAIDGELFRVTGDTAVPLQVGDVLTLEEGEGVRTTKGSSAILTLADNSQVEMRERSQLAVMQRDYWMPGRKTDGRLDLERGSVIVEASNQGSGHLYVDTEDCNVAVTGTVFSVTSGMKGSRVSVVEGEVHVSYRGAEDVLHPGDQATTRDALNPVPVEQDIAWSRNREQYVQLLQEMRALGRELDQVLQPELRYDTSLLDIAPAGTVVYFAMPNISDELASAYELLQDRIATSVVMREWWEQHVQESGGAGEIEEILKKVRSFGEYLDEEIAMTLPVHPDGEIDGPLFLARSKNVDAFLQALSDQIAELEAEHGELGMQLLSGRLALSAPDPQQTEVYVWTQGDVVALTPDYENLWALEAALQGHEGTTLAGGPFHDQLADLYTEGVQWAVGVDIERLLQLDSSDHDQLESLGLLDIQHLIGERKQLDDRTENRAVLTFDQPRRRMAAWIAEPAPMGALDYISPDANVAAAFVMKDMGVIVDELFGLLGQTEVDFEQGLAQFEQEEGIDIRRDIAGPLGGEFAIALDGPILPTPSWKIVIEVYDPAKLQQTLKWFVDRINQEAQESGEMQGLALESESVGDRKYFRLESIDTGFAFYFLYDGGYLVAAPSRAMLDRALQNRDAGIPLTDSSTFLDLLPHDGEVNFSGMLYQNLSPILGPLSSTLDSVAGVPDEQRQFLQALSTEAKPSLALLYGYPEKITLSSSSEGGLFTSMMDQLSGASGLLGMQQSLTRVLEHGGHGE